MATTTREILTAYKAWGEKIVGGDVENAMYDDMTEFVNLRMETAESCLLLLENDKVADGLGLARSLLENYLLYMLMCRGRKFFKLQDRTDLSEGDFKKYLTRRRADWAAERAQGETNCLGIEKYPRAKRHLMYIYEGLTGADDPEFFIPLHFFHFQEFQPEAMRLPEDRYFVFHELEDDVKKAFKKHREDETERYRYFLSYDALLQCLELNGILDKAGIARVEAHYTFLGKFLHPTHGASRDLHVDSNHHRGGTGSGLSQPYTKEARLLAHLYVCHVVAGLLDENAGLFEAAPGKYFRDPATAELRELSTRVNADYGYFWFLFNGPTLYDKFKYASHQATANEWAELGGRYENVPDDRVKFDKEIYRHFTSSLQGWRNSRCTYRSPLGR
ncbi:hypothetical protein LWP59_34570 [Amycolatopsis acidiphila]|uniref:Uncharacterized protein n=1 Tax=Amycolatopsis acidiphila TaxID=715473 RepID=A0A558A0K1_9PSEU|nr:hypothetical protein [Amycolatopsis acidiphila]TVT17785.1 hypothetical protein FNH06_30035 [Amycolatopsis acidiphila]UIJ59129.1 hypothetical protein LWP59_34570 [Amycolatopsis acidiphila]GHG97999.1 hypothetical protein GCM10017788_77750 [Amycolatopsis acidiphila]